MRIVVPFAAGGGTDIQARVLGKYLQEQFSQPFIVDNRAGASGLIGVRVTGVPYKGGGLSMVAMIGKSITLAPPAVEKSPFC